MCPVFSDFHGENKVAVFTMTIKTGDWSITKPLRVLFRLCSLFVRVAASTVLLFYYSSTR